MIYSNTRYWTFAFIPNFAGRVNKPPNEMEANIQSSIRQAAWRNIQASQTRHLVIASIKKLYYSP